MNRRCHRAEELHSSPLPGDNCRIIWTYDLFCCTALEALREHLGIANESLITFYASEVV
jgi:hypothetical protein